MADSRTVRTRAAARAGLVTSLAAALALGACGVQLGEDDSPETTETPSAEPDPRGTPTPPADTGTALDLDAPFEDVTLRAMPADGGIPRSGAYECNGEPVTIPATGAAIGAMLIGECPAVTVESNNVSLLVSSSAPTELTLDASVGTVLLGEATNIHVNGSNNLLGFASAESVRVPDSMNELYFREAGALQIGPDGDSNTATFREAASITVQGPHNYLEYDTGGAPVDEGAANELVSGQDVSERIDNQLADLLAIFEGLASGL